MSKRIFTACLGTETNSFSPIPTGMDLFRRTMFVRGGQHGEKPNVFALPLILWRERARALGWEVREGLSAFTRRCATRSSPTCARRCPSTR